MVSIMAQRRPWSPISLFTTILALACLTLAQQPFQKYCSTQNTGSDNQPIFWHFMSLGYCHDACIGQYAFAVVNFKTCWCSNYVPYDQDELYQCGAQCPGFPSEACGGGDGSDYFGYVALQVAPSGTMGAPTNPPDTTTKTIISTPSPTTVYLTSVNTIVSTQIRTETPTAVPATQSSIPLLSGSHTPSPVATSVSEIIVTHVVTSVFNPPSDAPVVSQTPAIEQPHHSGLSGGAIAGIIIGVLAALALLSLFFFFFCWRPRRGEDGNERGLGRNASVLSKVGLLRNQNHNNNYSVSNNGNNVGSTPPFTAGAAGAAAAAAGAAGGGRARAMSENRIVSNQPPQIDTQVPNVFSSGEPSSATTMESRRGSRPLFVDQRLNPYALTMHQNASRSSIGTLEDNQDYSRPLEVKNPDPT